LCLRTLGYFTMGDGHLSCRIVGLIFDFSRVCIEKQPC